MVNFGPLTAEIGSGVWGTPANFNVFRVLAALMHGSLVVGVSQTLRRPSRWHWPTFLVLKQLIWQQQYSVNFGPHRSTM